MYCIFKRVYLRVWDIQEAEKDHQGFVHVQNVAKQHANRGAIEENATAAKDRYRVVLWPLYEWIQPSRSHVSYDFFVRWIHFQMRRFWKVKKLWEEGLFSLPLSDFSAW